jgi:hypothetical protein
MTDSTAVFPSPANIDPARDARMLDAAQVWYVANVHPESVTAEEAAEETGWQTLSAEDRSYWDAVATVLQRLATAGATGGPS